MRRILSVILMAGFLASGMTFSGCSKSFWGGAAAGVAGTGAAYEYQNKRQMDKLEEDYAKGAIDKDEYEKRKQQIEKGSIIY